MKEKNSNAATLINAKNQNVEKKGKGQKWIDGMQFR